MIKTLKTLGLIFLGVLFVLALGVNTSKAETFSDLTVTGDARFQYPIYADGGLIQFGGGDLRMIDFDQGGSRIYNKGDLHVVTDDNLYFDFSNVSGLSLAEFASRMKVNDNFYGYFPIYATGNELVFDGGGVAVKTQDGTPRIYKDTGGSLRIMDTNLHIDVGTVTMSDDLEVGGNLSVTGTTTLTGNLTLTGDLAVNGGDLTSSSATFNLLNATPTTINFGGVATTMNIAAGGALARAINMGTGTGVDTITIGGGGTAADVIAIGDSLADVDVAGEDITLTSADDATLDITDDLIFDVEGLANWDIGENLDIDVEGTGAFTLNTVGGSITLTAAGATAGDMALVVGDDYTNTVTGLYLDTVTGTYGIDATGAVTVDSDAALTMGGAGIDMDADGTSNITLDTADGAINLTTVGATTGDVNLSVADDYRNVVGGLYQDTVTGTYGIDAVGALTMDSDAATTIGGASIVAAADGGTMDLDATGAVTIDSSGGAIGIGTDADAQNINIGTGAAARTITIGELTTLTEVQVDALLVDINAGGTGLTVDSASTIDLQATTGLTIDASGGAISIGSDAADQNVNIGTAGVRTIDVGSALATEFEVDALLVDINAGGTGMTVDSGASYALLATTTIDLQATTGLTIDSSGGAIGIGTDADVQDINIGTSATARAIAIGNAASASLALDGGVGGVTMQGDTTVAIDSGTTMDLDAVGALTMDSDAGVTLGGATVVIAADGTTLDLDATTALSINTLAGQTLSVGNDAVAQVIAIGNAAAGSLALDGGVGGVTMQGDTTVAIDSGTTMDLDAVGALTMDSDAATTIGGATVAIAADGTTLDLDAATTLSINVATGQALNVGNDAVAQTITIGNDTGATSVAITAGTGDVTITGGLKHTGGRDTVNLGAAVDCDGGIVATVAQVLDNRLFEHDAAANETLTLPTAQGAGGLVQALPGTPAVGDTFWFVMSNASAANTLQLVAGAGATLDMPDTVIAADSRTVFCRVTDVTGDAETITCY